MITCPFRKGEKRLFGFVDRWGDAGNRIGQSGWMDCHICNGHGEITDDHAERIAEGKRIREERFARGETLIMAAANLGISVSQLSALEHGRLVTEGDGNG